MWNNWKNTIDSSLMFKTKSDRSPTCFTFEISIHFICRDLSKDHSQWTYLLSNNFITLCLFEFTSFDVRETLTALKLKGVSIGNRKHCSNAMVSHLN